MINYLMDKLTNWIAWLLNMLFDKEFFEAGLKETLWVVFTVWVVISIVVLIIYYII